MFSIKDITKAYQSARSGFQKAGKTVGTLRFIFFGYINSYTMDNHVFRSGNRAAFDAHLKKLKPKDIKTAEWVKHLDGVNKRADFKGVTLLEDELAALTSVYRTGNHTTVYRALDAERKLFGKNASKYEEGTLNHDLRTYRPPNGLLFNGNLTFNKR